MGAFFDLHRHDECSFFDGFGNPRELAVHAKNLGYPALGISNHGNITGLVRHWRACEEVGIKPVMGCEVYFQPVFKKDVLQRKSYHLCLFVKNMQGYKNLCHMLTEANMEQFYYRAMIDFRLLEKYHEGIICTSACIASATSQAIVNNNIVMAEKLIKKFKSIFGEDYYIEIQPYKVDKKGTQQRTDYILMGLARKYKVRCILTSDSHYAKKEDFDTYCKMHEIGKTTLDVKNTYGERYMPTEIEIVERFCQIYKSKFKDPMRLAEKFVGNMKEIYDKVEDNILLQCQLHLPDLGDKEASHKKLVKMVEEGLKKHGRYTKTYVERCREELDIIHYHGFDDYFLIVQDYVEWAKEHDIEVGDGRGSVCNCQVACEIGITNVDSMKYKLDFSRFMRKDKKTLPDIDIDFETDKRQQVINYVVKKYDGMAVQICSYGKYDIDNLINDLSGVCGLVTTKEVDEDDRYYNQKVVSELKKYVREFQNDDGMLDIKALQEDVATEEYNNIYDNIIKHFCKLYGKIRQLGKHAAGVAVVGTDISDYMCMVRQKDKNNIMFSSCYDKDDLEHINCTKFDMLGLRTLSELFELKKLVGKSPEIDECETEEIFAAYREGRTDGIFQMEKKAPKKILNMIHCDCIEDVIAVNALNRPAPLQLKMHETYAYNKLSGEIDTTTPYYKYTRETYGTILYQEQTVEVAQKLGHLTSKQSFDMLKIMKKPENLNKPEYVPVIKEMKKDFYAGCRQEGLDDEQIARIWASLLIYGFNKGHSTGYVFIGMKQMWYKINYPMFYWYVKMKYARNDSDLYKFSELAVKDGSVVMLPHVNYGALTNVRKMEGEFVIQQGLTMIKGIGVKAAETIQKEREQNGRFTSYDDFYDRCKSRSVTQRVINLLEENGALEFNKNKYIKRVIKYNSVLMAR